MKSYKPGLQDSSADTQQFAQINRAEVCAQVREYEFPHRRLRGEVESVREESREAAEVLDFHRDVHLLLSETECLLHHTLVLQLRQRAGGVEKLTSTTSRPEPCPENKDQDTSDHVQFTITSLLQFQCSVFGGFLVTSILQIKHFILTVFGKR